MYEVHGQDICTSQDDNKTLQENIQRDVYHRKIIQPGIYGCHHQCGANGN